MHFQRRFLFFMFSLFLTTSLFSTDSFAHSDDINQATLSIYHNDSFQLKVTIDFLHLLKGHLDNVEDEFELIEQIHQLSFIEQKELLDKVHARLSEQSWLRFSDIISNTEQQQHILFNGLQLQQLKRILAQPEKLTDFKTELHATGIIPEDAHEVSIKLAPHLGNTVLTVVHPQQTIINAGDFSHNFQINPTLISSSNGETLGLKMALALDYIYQGYIHILPLGLDHILFVLALLLFAKRRSTLLWQVSVFTLAHTITLALGIYGLIMVSSTIVEPLIALSIVYVAIENIYRAKQSTNNPTRLSIIFAFGLLHGLGFASVLSDVGLPASDYAMSLISFNLGVELGQLTVIALALVLLYPLRNKTWYQSKLVLVVNIFIALVASYWLIERLT